ncbi:MAG TPA: SufE family protein [Gemmatimonadaceae bacterium]|nr:SufE family protein [Gemmatimonadaceae bacterium]
MESAAVSSGIPPSVDRVLRLFRSMSREEKMQALVQYSKKLEPFPERFKDLDRGAFNIPECQTRVDIIPELRNGKMHFYADLNLRESPTIAAVLAIVFAAVNDQPPSTTLGIPSDFVSILMESIGLAAREPGLNAMITRLKRYAREAQSQTA